MTKGFWATTCNIHGTISARNESTKWIKVQPSKHPRDRSSMTGCPFCRRELRKREK